jgi:hypothetical protein
VVGITEISAVVAAAGVLVGIAYYVLQMRHQTKIRKTDLIIRLYSATTSDEFMDTAWKVTSIHVKDYEDYVKQYGSFFSENPIHRAVIRVCGMYDIIGTLLYKKLIDHDLAYNVVGIGYPKMLYEILKPIMLGIRRETNESGAFVGFDYLCDELTRKEPQLKKAWGKYISQPVSDAKLSNQSSR